MDSDISLQSVGISHEILNLIAELDEFKGQWEALKTLSPERLLSLRHVATIESIGSSTRIEGVNLSDREIETLLANLQRYAFKSRDEEEIAGYAAAMDLLFESYAEISLTENHIKQLHTVLLQHSKKDKHHRGQYKKLPNHVVAFDKAGREKILAKALPALSTQILTLLKQHERLTIAEIEQLTVANRNTLKVRLRELTTAQQIMKHGRAKATWYTLK